MVNEHTVRGVVLITIVAMFGASAIFAEEFPLPPYDDVVTLPVAIDGESHVFIVDTGAFTMFVDSSLPPKLGKDVGTGLVSEQSSSKFEAPLQRCTP